MEIGNFSTVQVGLVAENNNNLLARPCPLGLVVLQLMDIYMSIITGSFDNSAISCCFPSDNITFHLGMENTFILDR